MGSFLFSSRLESSSKTDLRDNSFCMIAEGCDGFKSRLNLPLLSEELALPPVSRVNPDHFSYRSSNSLSRSSRSIVVGSGTGSFFGGITTTSSSLGGDRGGVLGLLAGFGLVGLGAGIATVRRP